jgi:hypothetical protein
VEVRCERGNQADGFSPCFLEIVGWLKRIGVNEMSDDAAFDSRGVRLRAHARSRVLGWSVY